MPSVVEPTHAPLPTEWASNGCFETMRAYGGRIFRLDEHLERLYASAKYLGLAAPADRRRLKAQLTQALAASHLQEAVVRIALVPGLGRSTPPHPACWVWGRSGFRRPGKKEGALSLPGGLHKAGRSRPPRGKPDGALPSIIVQPAQLPSATAYRRGIRVAVVPTQKFTVSAIDPQAKYSARLSSIMAVVEAQLRGVDEALFVDALGSVTESTASNFSIIKGGVLITPPCWLGLLRGITRDVVLELAQALRIPAREVPLTRHEVYTADEAFLSSTTKEFLPVTQVDGRTIGTGAQGPVTKRLHRALRALITRELRNGRR